MTFYSLEIVFTEEEINAGLCEQLLTLVDDPSDWLTIRQSSRYPQAFAVVWKIDEQIELDLFLQSVRYYQWARQHSYRKVSKIVARK